MSTYRVIGSLAYRGHPVGSTFVAVLERDVERRAVRRGNIEILDRTPVGLDLSKIRPPKG